MCQAGRMEFEHQFYNLVGVVRLELRLNCPISYFAREKKMYKSFFIGDCSFHENRILPIFAKIFFVPPLVVMRRENQTLILNPRLQKNSGAAGI